MHLRTELRLAGGVAIVDVSGRLASLQEEETLRDRLVRIHDDGFPRILLNLEQVGPFDSAGLGDLIASYAAITRRGGVMNLLRPPSRLREMLRRTHIDSLFDVWEDEGAAVAALKGSPRRTAAGSLTDFLNG